MVAHQVGENRVEITWEAPLTRPRRGYLLTVTGSSGFTNEIFTDTSPHRVFLTSGVYSIQLQALSEHYPSEVVGPVNVIVRGESVILLCTVHVITLTYRYVNKYILGIDVTTCTL